MPRGRPKKLSTLKNPLEKILEEKVTKSPKKLKPGSWVRVSFPAMVIEAFKGNKDFYEIYCEGHHLLVNKHEICFQ